VTYLHQALLSTLSFLIMKAKKPKAEANPEALSRLKVAPVCKLSLLLRAQLTKPALNTDRATHSPQTVLAMTFPCGRLPRLQSNERVNHCSTTEKRLCRCSPSAWQKNYCGTTADTRLHKMSSSHCSSSFWSCLQLKQDLLSK